MGKTEQEINDNWGEPDSMLSGFYGDIYVYEERQIVIYYDGDINMEFRANYQSGIEGPEREECGGKDKYKKYEKMRSYGVITE